MSFNDKVVLVTGGASGIGAATVISFAKEGAHVAIVDKTESALKKIEEEVVKVGKKPLIIKADISNDEEAKTIVEKTIHKFGKLDVLVSNAGIVRFAKILDENLLQVYDEVMNVNLRPTVLLTNLAAPHLVKTKGNIVNICSVAGMSTLGAVGDGNASYSVSKAGLLHFSRVSALELADKGVRVNTISPGPANTDIVKNAGLEPNWEAYIQMTALKVLIQPEEISDLILYLASDKAKSITGANYLVDGGCLLIC